MNREIAARRVIYHGRVQGVGFRATTRHIARGFAVAGFVRNLADGTVELQAQGDDAEVGRFLDQIAGQFGSNITRTDELPVAQEYSGTGFTIL